MLRKRVGESNGEHVHITVSMILTLFVRFTVEVEVDEVKNGDGGLQLFKDERWLWDDMGTELKASDR
jgi:hypothetical protein